MSNYTLIVVNASWGEIDWILPYLLNKKESSSEKFICYFNSDKLFDEKESYKDLYLICHKIFDVIIYPSLFIKKFNLPSIKYLTFKDIIKLFLSFLTKKTYYYDNNNKLLLDFFIEKKIAINKVYHELGFMKEYKLLELLNTQTILYPHAQTIRGFEFQKISENKKNVMKDPFVSSVFIGSKILVGDKDEKNFWKSVTKIDKYETVGYPRLNKKWRDFRIKSKIDLQLDDNCILFLVGKYNYIGFDEIKVITKNILLFAKKRSLKVIIKPHPRNINNSILYKFADNIYKGYLKSENSIFYESQRSNVMISTSKSGACMDAIYNNCPVLEYFRYGNKKNRFLEFESAGNLTSIYNYYGIAKNIYHDDYLETLSNIYNKKSYKKTLIGQQKSNLINYLNQN